MSQNITVGTAYLVPIRIKPGTKPTISNVGATTYLTVGTKIFVNKTVYLDKDVHFVLITRRT